MLRLVFTLLLLPSVVWAKEPFSLSMPIDCDYGKTCFIQNYVDRNPGSDRSDYACGRLSYDGHKGTDFRIENRARMRMGVNVLAAAGGTVLRIRNDMADRGKEAVDVKNREAGNGLVIDHGQGWETQYAHMKKGSVRVKPGDRVKAGDVLGHVGYSGKTEFAHLHISVRHNGNLIDPFTGDLAPLSCPERPLKDGMLWAVDLPYIETAVISAGFGRGAVTKDKARNGEYENDLFPKHSPAIVFWADVMGTLEGDIEYIEIRSPDGTILHKGQKRLEKDNISWFSFAGKRLHAPLPSGVWTGSYRLMRNGRTVADTTKTIRVE